MDSTLRGNLGQELDAVVDVYGFEAALIVPAFPRIGRTTVNGVHYIHGVPVNETEIAKDPKTPVPEADVAKLLSLQSRRSCISIDLPTLRSGETAVRLRIEESLKHPAPYIILDAETDEDMKLIAGLVADYENRFLWAGSAGLAEHLQAQGSGNTGFRPQLNISAAYPIMLVAGSISKVTRDQVAAFNEQPGVVSVEMDPLALMASPGQWNSEEERCFRLLVEALNKGLDVSLYAGSSPEQVRLANEMGAQIGLDSSSVSNRIADSLGGIAGKVVSVCRLGGLVLTGGDTAKAVSRHMGVRGIQLLAELEAGIPLGRLLGAGNLLAVTKAGAFGNKESLLYAKQILKGESAIV